MVRFVGRRRREGELTFRAVDEPPWIEVFLAGGFGVIATLTLLGIDVVPDVFPLLGPAIVVFAGFLLYGLMHHPRVVSIQAVDGHRVLTHRARHDPGQVDLVALASVSREPAGAAPALSLADLRGASVRVPLGTWTDEERLHAEIASALQATGAQGDAGDPVPVRRPGWVIPLRIATTLVSLASIVVLVNGYAQEETVEPVTPERIAANAGATASPFAGSLPCTVYVLPLGRASQERADEVSRRLAMDLPVQPCSLPSLALDTRALDLERGQLDASILTGLVRDLFVAEWGDRPATVVGVTEHDLFSPASPDDRFVFGFLFPETPLDRGFGVISTARMGSGDDLARRLQTMAVRYVGVGYFGLERDSEKQSALYEPIRSRADLDRMRPQLGDPPLSELELRHARALLLAGA